MNPVLWYLLTPSRVLLWSMDAGLRRMHKTSGFNVKSHLKKKL
jgi:hypothetical protein